LSKGSIKNETLTNELAETLRYNIRIVCYYQIDRTCGYQLRNHIDVEIILPKLMSMRKAFPRVVYYLVKHILKYKVDILVASGSLYFPAAIIASKLTGCKIICSDHSNYLSVTGFKYERQARNFAAKYCDVLITLTNRDKENYLKNTRVIAKIDSIPNIMEDRLFIDRGTYKCNSKKIISVGRLTYAKNYELLIDIADLVLKKHSDWSWDIYGNGELQSKLENKIKDLNIERLNLMGAVSNIYDVYQDYAFLVLTSRYEGYPMVLLESIAKKVPVVSFDCPTGPSEIIDHAQTGLLIKENDITAMVEAIDHMILNDSKRIKMSNACELAIKKFSKSEIIEKWNSYLDK
jgi:glycosyltransferase involved in cell wall biosynthesis